MNQKFVVAILIFLGAALSHSVSAQRAVPSAYPAWKKINFVRTWDALAPETDGNNLISRQLPDVKMATQYLDGLGRPLQTVVKEGALVTETGTKGDIVAPVEYDIFGREQYKYLPYTDATTDGAFKNSPFSAQATFMNSQYGSATQGETWYYGQTVFESSPLNRPVKSLNPGNNWIGANRGTETKYWLNTTSDAVRIWNVFNSATLGQFATYSSSGIYPAGQLQKLVTVDEMGSQVIEFKDKNGSTILKKVQNNGTADTETGSDQTGWTYTYYLYDEINNLRCVIQPKGVELVRTAGWVLTNVDILNEQCFRYEYDQRNRMIIKKVPGAEAVFMVYDNADRLVMTQDGAMRSSAQKKWKYLTYDFLNRPVSTGLITDATNYNNLLYHLNAATSSNNYPNLSNYPGYEELTTAFYDNYDWQSSYVTGLSTAYNTSYDSHLLPASNAVYPYAQANAPSNLTLNAVTGSRTKVLGTSSYLYSAIFYDAKKQPIQIQSKNNTGGIDVSTTQYSWSGQALINASSVSGPSANTSVIVSKSTYDNLGRLLKTEKKVGNSLVNSGAIPSAYVTASEMKYDATGNLKVKSLGRSRDALGSYTSAPLENLTYDYNIRGWMLGINRGYLSNTSTNYFGMELAYDKTVSSVSGTSYAAAQYAGNIAGWLWKSKGDGVNRQYDFTYDNLNRLMKADFKQKNSDGSWNNNIVNYNVKMGDGLDPTSAYDANGNILRMQQWGLKAITSGQIDDLSYNYISGSNKLSKVTDAITGPDNGKLSDFKDGSNGASDDYSYDVNGNLVLDNNKSISSIVYNILNLPQQINVTGKGTINYVYDASGTKLSKQVQETNATVLYDGSNYTSDITTTTVYLNGAVYESKSYSNPLLASLQYTNQLQFLPHEEGRIRYKSTATPPLEFDYFIKDHLGNVRMVLTDEYQQPNVYPAATLENTTYNGRTAVSTESLYYTIDATKIVNNPSGSNTYTNNNGNPPYNNNPYSNTSATTGKMYRTNAGSNKTGLGIVLKVMAGDKVNIYGKSFHQSPVGGYTGSSSLLSVADIIGSFTSIPGMAAKGITSSQITSQSGFPSTVTSMLGSQPAQTSGVPRAFINWIMFDEQFGYAGGGFDQVGASGTVKSHTISTIPTVTIPKNGYIYVYVSNESNYDVFFDNLQLIHTPGPILEETHYYPFGLTMAGISSQILKNNYPENKSKFNKGSELQNKEFSDGSGLDMYSTLFRMYDPQIGRWNRIDPKPNEMVSPYVSMDNNPISFNDPFGDTITIRHRSGFLGIFGKMANYRYDNGTLYNSSGAVVQRKGLARYVQKAAGALEAIRMGGPTGQKLITSLQNSTQNTYVMKGSVNKFTYGGGDGAKGDNGQLLQNVVRWSPGNTEGGLDQNGSSTRPGFIGLGHELAHADDNSDGGIDGNPWFTIPANLIPGGNDGRNIVKPNAELYSTHIEDLLRAENNLPLRVNYMQQIIKDPNTGLPFGLIITPGTRTNANTFTANGTTYTNPNY